MITAAEAKNIIIAAEQEPGQWMAAMSSIVVDFVDRLDKLENEHAITRKGAMALAREAKGFRKFFNDLKAQFGEPETAVVGAAPSNGNGGVRLGADGQPLSAEQAAIEAQADATFGPRPGEAPVRHSHGGPSAHRPMPPRGGVRLDPGNGQPMTTADAAPLDPSMDAAQARAEADADAIFGPRS